MWLYFALHGGTELSGLKVQQITVHKLLNGDEYLKYHETGSKNNPGGLLVSRARPKPKRKGLVPRTRDVCCKKPFQNCIIIMTKSYVSHTFQYDKTSLCSRNAMIALVCSDRSCLNPIVAAAQSMGILSFSVLPPF